MTEPVKNDAPPAPPPPPRARRAARTVWRAIRRTLLGAVGLALAAVIVLAFLPKPVSVDVATVHRADMRVTIDEDGRTRVKDRYVVSAPLTGRIARIELRPGDAVEEGTIIARIAPMASPLIDTRTRAELDARIATAVAARRQTEQAVARARTALEFAAGEHGRVQELAGAGGASARELARAQIEARSAQEALTSAELGARVAAHEVRMIEAAAGRIRGRGPAAEEQLEVTSPTSGRVLRLIQVSEGIAAAGTPLVEIGDPGALEIVVDVLTSDAVSIEPGQRAAIERWGGDGDLEAVVRTVEPSAFTRLSALGVEEQRVDVVLDLVTPRERWAALGDGYRVEVAIVTWEATGILQAPATAVFRRGDGFGAYELRDGRAALAPVQVGRRNGLAVEVLGGLMEGTTVIVHPSDAVTDGVSAVAR